MSAESWDSQSDIDRWAFVFVSTAPRSLVLNTIPQ